MSYAPRKTASIDAGSGPVSFQRLVEGGRPVIIKGLVADWPVVKIGRNGPEAVRDYLARYYTGAAVVGYEGVAEISGRFFYNADLTGLNFTARRVSLTDFLSRVADTSRDAAPPSLYVGSTDVDVYLPGFRRENDLDLNDPAFSGRPPQVGAWIGNRTIATAHFDMSNNIACCVAGRRRFTLFPPESVACLYPGPLEPTPGGQVVSMVDFNGPDFEAYPDFRKALAAGETAELEAGDVLVYPALWWHHVVALEPFNMLVNYWWNDAPAHLDTPMTTLLHGLLSIRDRPQAEKDAWRFLFDYYVFGSADRPRAHLPAHAHGALARLDEASARRLRAFLMQRLNR